MGALAESEYIERARERTDASSIGPRRNVEGDDNGASHDRNNCDLALLMTRLREISGLLRSSLPRLQQWHRLGSDTEDVLIMVSKPGEHTCNKIARY
eukprot:SAG11_NODE_808_length_7088_cov_5.136357_6_plen_97_part_00